ncbi:MAG: hypothetical protein ACRD21_10105 [Vicinamibacteria bacterium]
MTGFFALALALFSLLGPACSTGEDCDDIKKRAGALVAEFAACDAGESCVVVDLGPVVGNACLGDFQCFAALAGESDLSEFSRRARTLEQEFARCEECAMADCSNPEGWTASCDEAQGGCRLRAPE